MYYSEQKEFKTVSLLSWEIGAHTKFSKNIYDTLKKSIYYSMYVTQFFLGSPKSFTRHRAIKKDIDKSKELLNRYPLHVFSHFPYVANLAGSVKQLAWDGNLL
jgi:endonuclease IV